MQPKKNCCLTFLGGWKNSLIFLNNLSVDQMHFALPVSNVHLLCHFCLWHCTVWHTLLHIWLVMRRTTVVSRTHSAGVGDDQRDTIKTVIISFITISLTGEPNSPFSFNLPNENFGLVPYSRTGSILNKKYFSD